MSYIQEYDLSMYNSAATQHKTYNILRAKYEEKYEKYRKADDRYKQTAEYARLEKIVKRLRATLVNMEKNMSR